MYVDLLHDVTRDLSLVILNRKISEDDTMRLSEEKARIFSAIYVLNVSGFANIHCAVRRTERGEGKSKLCIDMWS